MLPEMARIFLPRYGLRRGSLEEKEVEMGSLVAM